MLSPPASSYRLLSSRYAVTICFIIPSVVICFITTTGDCCHYALRDGARQLSDTRHCQVIYKLQLNNEINSPDVISLPSLASTICTSIRVLMHNYAIVNGMPV